jgi:glycosyltransferase involved in cell wall biosynthesis
MNRIVLGCFEVPGWGGLATATYRLFETMLADGLDVHYLNLIREEDVAWYRKQFGPEYDNPRSLANVHSCRLVAQLHESHPQLTALLDRLDPQPMVGMGDIAAYLMKRALPRAELVLFTGGCMQVDKVVPFTEQGIGGYGAGGPPTPDWKERAAVQSSARILAHSELIRQLYHHYYPADAHKIHPQVIWFAEWIHADAAAHSGSALPFEERDIDALFVASSWTREEKNYGLVADVVPLLQGLSVHVVGEVPHRIPSVTHHGIVATRAELFRIMGRARAVVCPSSFDAAPGILFEASAMGCNVVASKNCGNWALCHEALLVDPYTAAAFAERVRLARSIKLPDRMDGFLQSRSYRELTRVLLDTEAGRIAYSPRSEVRLSPATPRIVPHEIL